MVASDMGHKGGRGQSEGKGGVKEARRGNIKFKSRTVKLRSVVGVIERKNDLRCAMLNVDGLSMSTLEDVKEVFQKKKPDIAFILETKRREEEIALDARVDGYSLTEIRRSDCAGDRGGWGDCSVYQAGRWLGV